MRIIMAGASGYLGRALRGGLDDHDIVRLVRRSRRTDDEIPWDPYGDGLDSEVLKGADAVIDLCGAPIAGRRWNREYKDAIRRSRIIPTQEIAAAVAEAEVPVLLNASAVGWYGDTGGHEVDETAPHGSDFLGRTCAEWELAADAASEAGTRVVKLRTGHVIGRGSPLLAKMAPIFRLFLGGRFGDGRQAFPWISLDDWVSATIFLLENEVDGPVNMVGPTPVTNRHFTRALADALGRPAPWVIPGWAAKIAAGEAAVELLRGAKVVPKTLREAGFAFEHRTVEEALAEAFPRVD
ncbi:TIGR01777 family oxidoreductase [Salininema proteolyticum]|uniref:TIGR01777 family oxidoreductase n=1 Tax=Salininema proteolyticum TaxID=1607685 RepID=A0ABV8TUV5_9ACTN